MDKKTSMRVAMASALMLIATSAWSADSSSGRALYEEKCAMCHRAQGMGTGLLARRYPKGQEELEQRTSLSAALVIHVVRNGLNNMPALPRAEVDDRQLEEIAKYLSKGTP
jgi:mono/diheme cytochrome c family protein